MSSWWDLQSSEVFGAWQWVLLSSCVPWGACPVVLPMPLLRPACPLGLHAGQVRGSIPVTPRLHRYPGQCCAQRTCVHQLCPAGPFLPRDLSSLVRPGARGMGSGVTVTCCRSLVFPLSAVWLWAELLTSSEPEFPHLWADNDNTSLAWVLW